MDRKKLEIKCLTDNANSSCLKKNCFDVEIALNMLNEFRIQIWEANKFCLIQIHHEKFVSWS